MSQEDSIDRVRKKFMIRQHTGELVEKQAIKPRFQKEGAPEIKSGQEDQCNDFINTLKEKVFKRKNL